MTPARRAIRDSSLLTTALVAATGLGILAGVGASFAGGHTYTPEGRVGDTIELRQDERGHFIFYDNDAGRSSVPRTLTFQVPLTDDPDGPTAEVFVEIEVNAGCRRERDIPVCDNGAADQYERITVTPEPPFMAWPGDPVDVPDGETTEIRLIGGLG